MEQPSLTTTAPKSNSWFALWQRILAYSGKQEDHIWLCGSCDTVDNGGGRPLLTGVNPSQQNLGSGYKLPIWAGGQSSHPLGTDSLGRDILTRLLYGFQIAAYIGFVSAFFVALIGTPIGLISGYFRGRLDARRDAHRGHVDVDSARASLHCPNSDPRQLR